MTDAKVYDMYEELCSKNMKIGVFGGTFDPVHYGHLIIAEGIREEFCLDKVLFVPTGIPPHKSAEEVAGAEHRFNMVHKAVKGNPFFEVSRIETERAGYTYTIDTLNRLKSIYEQNSRLFMIVGADIVGDLLTWKEPEKVISMCEFIAVSRPGCPEGAFLNEIESLKRIFSAKIHMANAPLIEISSTTIREKIRNNKSVKYLVPEDVEAYISENKLYGIR